MALTSRSSTYASNKSNELIMLARMFFLPHPAYIPFKCFIFPWPCNHRPYLNWAENLYRYFSSTHKTDETQPLSSWAAWLA